MYQHKCKQCGEALPPTWRPTASRQAEVVCPNCAVLHMRTKSERREAIKNAGNGSSTALPATSAPAGDAAGE